MKSDGMLNSTTWLYGAEVLPIQLRSKIMGLAAASHFIVNVGSELFLTSAAEPLKLTTTRPHSHGSRSQRVRKYP